MSTATSTQTTSTECPSTESSTTAADPVLTREEAIAILAGPGQRTAGTFKTRRCVVQRDARSISKDARGIFYAS